VKTLILGGVRSGKSQLAEKIARDFQGSVTYIATATALDDEMAARISRHKTDRPADWQLIEEPVYLADALFQASKQSDFILVDCLTMWLTNLLSSENIELFSQQRALLLAGLMELPQNIIMVSNETSMGVVPMGELSRRFCDEAGWLHQDLAQCCDRVILTVAGLLHYLKGSA
jgi:adenosylcobinamide kinase / adenosylcobinamide-phosphate guanylyltransferase